ncbi:MAG: Asp-tRNA(Asn)/Glu-tRNA(Gln) amidotransferase subunit GatA [Candidatus Vogelbacteria bacterium]|nr:Asp-tRNA(Asn)/Glu-tRNA(Gln) amidotransferase subunit GatA [Candidatus Vogelbacteria bacterium]
MTITEAARALRARELTATELTQGYLNRIKEKNPAINAYLEVFDDALEQASVADEKFRQGRSLKKSQGPSLPPLLGIPLAIKDNILIKDKIASAASKMLAKYCANYDATVIKKLKAAGAIFLGRTNMDEFAMGGSTENSAFGPTKNPRDTTRVAGGSSGGSAASVAADLCVAALGSDTGGSIRQPASFCGVVGLKPTYGAVSRSGLIAMASSLDQIGPLAQTVEDAEILFEAIRGRDDLDSTSKDTKHPMFNTKHRMLRVGVPYKFLDQGLDPEVAENFKQSVEKLKSLGYEIKEIDLPNLKYSLACYYIIMPAEASTNLARFDGLRYGLHLDGANLLEDYTKTRGQGFGREVRRRIILGAYVLSAGYYDAYYGKATAVRSLIKQDFTQTFKTVDAMLTPTAPTTAFKIGEKTADPLQMYLEDIFTVPANLAGLPALSLPSGKDKNNLPFGLQITAASGREDTLFQIGKKFMS